MKQRRWAEFALVLLVACAFGLAGCCLPEREEDPMQAAQDRFEQARMVCPALADVQNQFGATLGGTYGGATLLEYSIGGVAGAPVVTPPNGSMCAQEIANRLSSACGLCQNQPAECLNLVSGFFGAPSASCSYCGDGVCSLAAEGPDTCPADCLCGNGLCDAFADTPETPLTCAADCGGTCGDRYCAEPLEQCSCDGVDGECVECVEDCCVAVCGDGQCDVERGEAELDGAGYCEVDCGGGSCGDDICQPTENPATCPLDCELFLSCGDGQCAFPETCANCPADCDTFDVNGAGPTPSVCLDGVCGVCEVTTCRADCEGVAFECGDGVCEGVEHPANCPGDCRWGECTDTGAGLPLACPNETCGDGVCGHTETISCGDCDIRCQASASHVDSSLPVCVAGERYCGRQVVDGVSVDVIFDCADPIEGCPVRPSVLACPGRCKASAQGAICVDCPPIPTMGNDPQLLLCPEPFESFCTSGTRRRTCILEPAYSTEPGCGVLREEGCPGGCEEGRCAGPGIISGFLPPVAPVGVRVEVFGINFGEEQGSVTFAQDREATVELWEERLIRVLVPDGAVSGEVVVTTATGGVIMAPFTVADVPTVVGVFPPGGTAGDTVTLSGFGFGQASGTISFEPGLEALVLGWDDEVIRAVVPEGALSGVISVAGPMMDWVATSPSTFEVDTLPVVVTGFSPSVVEAGDTVTFSGRYFADDIEVFFFASGETAPLITSSFDTLTVQVPFDAETGPIDLRRFGQGYGTSDILTVLPSVGELSVCGAHEAFVGDPVVLVGRGLGPAQVYFSGVDAPVAPMEGSYIQSELGNSQILVIVPEGAQTGPLTLTLEGLGSVVGPVLTVLARESGDRRWAQWRMPDSETLVCMGDNGRRVIDCPTAGEPYYGQDANYDDPPPSYSVVNEVVTDDVTGLSWVVSTEALPWWDAVCTCRNGTWGDQSDWRLPTTIEMMSIQDAGVMTTTTTIQGLDAPAGRYWAREVVANDPSVAWVITNGFPANWHLLNTANSSGCVR